MRFVFQENRTLTTAWKPAFFLLNKFLVSANKIVVSLDKKRRDLKKLALHKKINEFFGLIYCNMDSILEKYDFFKIDDCINLLNVEKKVEDGLADNFIKENCMNVCQCLDAITRNDFSKINENHTILFRTYQNIVAVDLPGKSLPIQLELTTFFNFIWWNFYYVIRENDEKVDVKKYLPVIQKGLRRALGISCKVNNYVNLTEDILYDIRSVSKKLPNIDYWTLSLLLEVIALTILYILKIDRSIHIMEECLISLKSIIQNCNELLPGLAAVKNFKSPCLFYNKLFKFGVLKMNSKVSNPDTCAIDCLNIIKCFCLFCLKKYRLLLSDMKENINLSIKSLWCYFGGWCSLTLNDFNQCLGFLIMADNLNFGNALKSRFNVLHGLLMSKKGKHKESLKFFGEAKKIFPYNKAAYYYMGLEYGKIGLNDEMIACFLTLVKVKEEENFMEICPFYSNFESVILDLLHPKDEITELEVLYAAAVALGIHERFQEAAKMFEKYLEIYPSENVDRYYDGRIVKTPHFGTILHEAAAVNILIGNILRAKDFVEKSLEQYGVKEPMAFIKKEDVHVSKDINWIRNVLDSELGLSQKSVEKQNEMSACMFTEEMVNFFEVDVIALMLSAEIEKRLESDTYTTVLGKLVSTFLKYIAQMHKKEKVELERINISLVKALSCKTCLNVAKCQIKLRVGAVETERMFKKALTCNPGDKDVLYEYSKFLLAEGKKCDAQNLWKTFHSKASVANVDLCQSLALRFLLQTHVSRRDLEKIESDLGIEVVGRRF